MFGFLFFLLGSVRVSWKKREEVRKYRLHDVRTGRGSLMKSTRVGLG
jgi:hypothetical protein